MKSFTFNTTPSIICEPGAIGRIGDICRRHRISRLLIVTDQGILDNDLLGPLLGALSRAQVSYMTYADVQADPPEDTVLRALRQAQTNNTDGVVGFGGGSSMDTAKLVALMMGSGESLAEIYGVDNASGQRLPLIQVPTTAGTGSEVTPIAIVTTGDTTKTAVVAQQLMPDVTILDPELSLGLPPLVSAATGIDAMVHAIEAFTSARLKNPYSDMLAQQALNLLAGNIRDAVHRGDSLATRQAMLLGACLAGQAFANAPVAAVHALAYPLGGHYHIPHGLSNALMLPHVLRFNCEAVDAARQYAQLAPIIMERHIPLPASDGERRHLAGEMIDHLVALIADLALPNTLAAMDIQEQELPMLAENAMQQQRLLVNNPREVNYENALNIYRAAYT
ncbi:iron-containing alcohol dehydrogenase [Exilibacterium tricleocarpae]|uniref:Iron-containing alcohol dehydrogenase n=1 Tax=Exilibacterium tricleocarpae TaxID=2591008 RepID=A0A545TLK1_9GAMM|nr:iron-containing alcohol dehydrogenase [Exilibacterium tricleocarpae]TQV78110.1 iron-containing alcohol dehydrogenase [Exilibacterium tricleocarpae]